MKATEQYFRVVLFITLYLVVLNFEYVVKPRKEIDVYEQISGFEY